MIVLLRKIGGLVFLVLLFTTCLDEIDLQLPAATPVLTVSGNIYTSPGPYKVFLTESAQFSAGAEGIPNPVSGATVKIMDDQGNEEILRELEAGEYQTAADGIRGTLGRTYQLEVQVNGKTYQSQPEEIRPIVSAESLDFSVNNVERINEAGNFVNTTEVEVFVNTFFPPSTNGSFLRWTTFGIYEYAEIGSQGNLNPQICYVTEDIDFDNVSVASSAEVQGDFLQQQPVITRVVDFRFTARYCFKVIQQSITENAYNFWSAVGAEFERSGDIFETPPGKIRGNVFNVADEREEVLGYFSAAAVDTISILIEGRAVGNPIPQCRPFPRGPESCTNCLLLTNSTRRKPDCWE
ncbi:MAG: DUF4249 domain-containing protein [Bacteroidota bacterium]